MSEGVEWGLHCAVVLAALSPGTTMAARDLAEFHGVSESYLVKHLKALSASGILESVSGPKGGFRFAKDPAQVTLLQVVEALEGPIVAFRCTEIRQRNPAASPGQVYRAPCALHAAMVRAERAYKDSLRSQTIADVVSHLAITLDPKQQERTAEWLAVRARFTHPQENES